MTRTEQIKQTHLKNSLNSNLTIKDFSIKIIKKQFNYEIEINNEKDYQNGIHLNIEVKNLKIEDIQLEIEKEIEYHIANFEEFFGGFYETIEEDVEFSWVIEEMMVVKNLVKEINFN